MTRFYVPREASVRETIAALAVALGVGGLSFYLVRMLIARDALETKAVARAEDYRKKVLEEQSIVSPSWCDPVRWWRS